MKQAFKLKIIFLIIIISLGLGGIFYVLSVIPYQVEHIFGDASPQLGQWERWRLAILLLQNNNVLTKPTNSLGNLQPFQIALGESPLAIAGRLKQSNLIKDESSFLLYLRYKGLDKTIQAGDYQLNSAMSPIQIAHTFQDATPKDISFRILEGWRIEEIAAALPTSGFNIDPQTFLDIARIRPTGFSFSAELPKASAVNSPYPIEGFLYPETYVLPRTTDAIILITTILNKFDEKVDAKLRENISNQGLTLYEGIILASIVDREAVVDDEKPIIASVFLNRLKKNMKLQADPTVQYAVGYRADRNGWWAVPLWQEDLEKPSPFNTYQVEGIPPAPICNPGLTSIEAVASPAQTNYFFFRALCDGSKRHSFSETYQQHLENACP